MGDSWADFLCLASVKPIDLCCGKDALHTLNSRMSRLYKRRVIIGNPLIFGLSLTKRVGGSWTDFLCLVSVKPMDL